MLKGSGKEGSCTASSCGEMNLSREAESGGISAEREELVTGGNAQSTPAEASSNERFCRGTYAEV